MTKVPNIIRTKTYGTKVPEAVPRASSCYPDFCTYLPPVGFPMTLVWGLIRRFGKDPTFLSKEGKVAPSVNKKQNHHPHYYCKSLEPESPRPGERFESRRL